MINNILFSDVIEYVFLVTFIFEMSLKMYALGVRVYFQSSFNIFDCVVSSNLLISILIILISFSDVIEYVFLVTFIFEMSIKMYALGVRVYFQSSFNRFDCVVSSWLFIRMIPVCAHKFQCLMGTFFTRCVFTFFFLA